MNKNKVAVFTYSLVGGGAERVAANVLCELHKSMEVELILVRNDDIVYDIPSNCKTTILSSLTKDLSIYRLLLLPNLSLKLFRYLNKNNIGVIISFMEFPNWLVTFMRFYGWSGKIIICEQVAPIQEFNPKTIRGKVGRKLNQFLYPKANKIIACSKGVQHELEHLLGINNNYSIIYNPINLKAVAAQIQNTIAEKYDKFTFINVSGFRAQKNHLLLIEAFAKIENDDCQLILVGKNFGDIIGETIVKKIVELGMEKKIILAGFTTNPYTYLLNADCFVMSSDYEGLPNVLLEAMYCNLQIISTDCRTGPREIMAPNSAFYNQCTQLEQNEFGYLTTVGNADELYRAMQLILNNKKSKNEMALVTQLRCKDFDLENIGKQYTNEVLLFTNN